MSLRAIAWQPRRVQYACDEVAAFLKQVQDRLNLLAMTIS